MIDKRRSLITLNCRDNLGSLLPSDHTNQLQPVCSERVCGYHRILPAVQDMEVRSLLNSLLVVKSDLAGSVAVGNFQSSIDALSTVRVASLILPACACIQNLQCTYIYYILDSKTVIVWLKQLQLLVYPTGQMSWPQLSDSTENSTKCSQ